MAEAAPTGRETEPDTPDLLGSEPEPAEIERLAELVYRLLREDVLRLRERRGESVRRWR